MKNSILTKNIRTYFNWICKEHGFKIFQGAFIKEENDILQIISIHSINGNIYSRIAMHPLYIFTKDIVLSFGRDFLAREYSKKFKIVESLEDLYEQLDIIKIFLLEKAFPWFNDYSSPKGLIEFIEKKYEKDKTLLFGFPPKFKYEQLGYNYLYLREYDKAKENFNLVIREIEDNVYSPDLRNKMYNMIEIIDTKPDEIHLILQNNINQLKMHFKL